MVIIRGLSGILRKKTQGDFEVMYDCTHLAQSEWNAQRLLPKKSALRARWRVTRASALLTHCSRLEKVWLPWLMDLLCIAKEHQRQEGNCALWTEIHQVMGQDSSPNVKLGLFLLGSLQEFTGEGLLKLWRWLVDILFERESWLGWIMSLTGL